MADQVLLYLVVEVLVDLCKEVLDQLHVSVADTLGANPALCGADQNLQGDRQ